ncbi:MAG: lipase [Gammaproteobacteria bacterium]|nr:lipase [Gammaproteobacteria bacterium]
MDYPRLRWLTVILLFILSGCAQNSAYRTENSSCLYINKDDCATHAIQQNAPGQDSEFELAFVEFNDQGQLRDRKQMQAVLDHYYKIASDNDVLLIVFAHGWHHSASPGDANILEFRRLLSRVSKIESVAGDAKSKARKVLGLYIGWRGDSITLPGLKEVTFWDRKSTAQEIGLQGVTEVLLKLEEIVNVKAGMEEDVPKPLNSRLVVIGHSFGGALIYTALQQVLADRFVDSRKTKTYSGDAGGFGDLVLLVNPAFEALRFATLYDISQHGCRRYLESQLPKLVILTSESDYATKLAFPLGRIFSTLFESHTTLTRRQCTKQGVKELLVDEGEADRNTVGHFEPYLTHRLLPAKTKMTRSADFSYRQARNSWARQQQMGTLNFEDTDLIHLGKTRPLNPYLNVKVDSELISDHNDIWGDSVISFVRDLIIISTLPIEAAN